VALTHNANITISIYLDSNPAGRASLTIPLLLVPISTNSLDGNRVVSYASTTEAQAAQTAGYISADTLAGVTRMFTQSPRPKTVKVGYINDSGAESEADALTALIAADPDFYGIVYQDRTDANGVALSVAAEAASKQVLVVLQSSNTDWKTGGVPAAFSSIVDNERTAVLYHDTDGDWNAEGWIASRMAFDPDEQSAPWHGRVKSGDALASSISETVRGLIQANNANVGLPYGPASYYVDPGYSVAGRPLHEQVSADWLAIRLREDVANAIVDASNRGEKIQVNSTGQAIMLGLISARVKQGQLVGHFDPSEEQVEIVAEEITAADIAADRLRFTVRVKIAGSLRVVEIDVYASKTDIAA